MSLKPRVRIQVELASQVKISEPPLYQVIMLNDDFTPMDFVVHILINIFNMGQLRAQQTMLEVHHLGKSIVGVYSREIAEMKVSETLKMGSEHGYPLRCIFEPAI